MVLVFLAAGAVFSGTLGHDLVWDDVHLVQYSREIVSRNGLAGLLTTEFIARPDDPADHSGYHRPVSTVSMWINDPAGEPSPFLFHLVNVLLHMLNSVLVLLLLNLLLPGGTGALTGAILFAVHPVHAESVAFVSGRTDLLCALFILVSVILWIRSFREGGGRRVNCFLAGMVSFALACFSKEAAFVYPGLAVGWALVFRALSREEGNAPSTRRPPWITGWFVILGLIVSLRAVFLDIGFGPGWSSTALSGGGDILATAGGVAANVAAYIKLLVFPWPLFVYYPPFPAVLTPMGLAASGGFAALCLALGVRRHRGVGLLALLWVLAFLAPVSGVAGLGSSVIAERFCYLPSIGLAMVAGYALGLLQGRAGAAGALVQRGAVLFLVLLLGAGAVIHASRWKDEVTLFSRAVRSGGGPVPTMYFNLGNALVQAGSQREGIAAFREAVRLRPGYVDAMLNLASAHIRLGEFEEAQEILARARDLYPDNGHLWYNSGVALDLLGRHEEALDAYSRAAELDPADPMPGIQAGKLLARLGRHEEGAKAYGEALLRDSGRLDALLGLARSREEAGSLAEAEEAYLRAMDAHPREVSAYLGLGRVYLLRGKAREAGAVFRSAVRLAPSDTTAHRGVVMAAYREGGREKAAAHIDRLAGTDPELAGELAGLLEELEGGEGR